MHFDEALEYVGEGPVQRFCISICSMVIFLEGLLTASMYFVLPQLACDVNCEWKYLVVSYAPYLFGCILGSYIFGALSDANGRKYSLHVSSIVTFMSAFMLASSSVALLIDISKFLLGFGLSGIKNGCHVIVFESLPPKFRGRRMLILDIISHFGTTIAIASSGNLLVGRSGAKVIFHLRLWKLTLIVIGILLVFGTSLLSLLSISARQMLTHQRIVSTVVILRRIYSIHNSVNEDVFGPMEIAPFENIERQRHRVEHTNGLIYFLCRLSAYTSHIFSPPRMLISMSLVLIHACLFNGSILLNSWIAKRIESGARHCYLQGAQAMNETAYMSLCQRGKSYSYELNGYLAFSSTISLFFLLIFIDRCSRKFIMMVTCIICSLSTIGLAYDLTFHWDLVVGIIVIIFHTLATVTLGVVILENYPTKFRCTANGLIPLLGKVLNIVLSFLVHEKCSYVFLLLSASFLGAAILSIFIRNLNNKVIQE